MKTIPATKCAIKVKGKTVFRYRVVASRETLVGAELVRSEAALEVLAYSAADAINHIRDWLAPHVSAPTELRTWHTGGGETYRFIGWESLMGARMFQERRDTQLPLL